MGMQESFTGWGVVVVAGYCSGPDVFRLLTWSSILPGPGISLATVRSRRQFGNDHF